MLLNHLGNHLTEVNSQLKKAGGAVFSKGERSRNAGSDKTASRLVTRIAEHRQSAAAIRKVERRTNLKL